MKEASSRRARTLRGIVVSDKMDKSVVVKVLRFIKHPRYQKYIRRGKNYQAHDEENRSKVGDTVTIRECRPRSRHKRFEVV